MMDPLISSPEYWWWNQEVFLVSNMADGPTDILPKILMVKPGSIFVSDMAMLMMTFLPGLHFVRGGEKFPRVREIPTLAVMSPARLLYVSRQATVGWSGSTGCMVSLDTWAFVCGWGIPVDLNGVLLPVMSGVYLWGYDARLPQVRLSFCLCCVMVEPPFLPASRWAKAS